MDDIAIRFTDVSKIYKLYSSSRRRLLGLFLKRVPHKEKKAVVDMNLTIHRGESVAVLGLICGIVPWFYMSEMLTLGTECILRNRYLVTKMKYPVSTIPTFTSISKFAVHLILLMMTILIFILTGHMPTVYMVQLPFYMLCNFLFFTGWALFAAPIAAISTDFSNLVKSFVTAVFWLSGILWEVDSMHNKLAHQLLMLNPVTFICNGYRNCFVYQTWFFEQPKRLLYFAVALVLIYALGFWSYRRTRSEMADVL